MRSVLKRPATVRRSHRSPIGNIELLELDAGAGSEFRVEFEEPLLLFVGSGVSATRERRVDSKPAPRDPTRPGEMNYFPAGTRLEGVTVGKRQTFVGVSPSSVGFDRMERGDGVPDQRIICAHRDRLCANLSLQIKAELNARKPDALIIETSMILLLMKMFRSANRKYLDSDNNISRSQISEIDEYISNNLEKTISLVSLAKLTGLPAARFGQIFKQATGRSPYKYVLQARIDRAADLLKSSDGSIADIALAVGFYSQSHLTAYFKAATGMTPARYRKSQ